MENITAVIFNSILAACGSAIFAGICVWVRGLYKKAKVYDSAIKALAHDTYFRYCRYLHPLDVLSEEEVENLNYLYTAYHSLGLNGTGDKLYNEIISKPIMVNEEKRN